MGVLMVTSSYDAELVVIFYWSKINISLLSISLYCNEIDAVSDDLVKRTNDGYYERPIMLGQDILGGKKVCSRTNISPGFRVEMKLQRQIDEANSSGQSWDK